MKKMCIERCSRTIHSLVCYSFVIICVLLDFQTCNAQTKKIDSLKLLLGSENSEAEIDILFYLSKQHLDLEKTEMGKYYARKAYLKAIQFSDTFRIVKTGRLFGQALRRLSKLDSALITFEKILPVAKRNWFDDEVKAILNGIALVYDAIGRFDKALQFHFESVELKKKTNDKFGLSVSFNNIARIYQDLKAYDQALKYYHESLILKNQIDSEFDLDRLLINMGQCYAFSGDFEVALRYVKHGLATCLENCADDSKIVAHHTLGYMAYVRKNYSDAKEEYLKALRLSGRAGFEDYLLESIEYLVKIALDLNHLDEAEQYLKDAELIISSGAPYNIEIVQVLNQMQSLFSRSKKYEKAYYYQNKYVKLKDSIYSYELTTNLVKVEAAHLEKEYNVKIDAQNKILALNEAVIFRQKFINVFICITTLLLISLAITLRRSIRQKQAINSLLDTKVKERTQDLELSQSLLQRVCEQRESQIRKTANDMNQTLSTIRGLCNLGQHDPDKAQSYLTKVALASELIFTSIITLRASNLHTTPDEHINT